jgi:hypothetical protein
MNTMCESKFYEPEGRKRKFVDESASVNKRQKKEPKEDHKTETLALFLAEAAKYRRLAFKLFRAQIGNTPAGQMSYDIKDPQLGFHFDCKLWREGKPCSHDCAPGSRPDTEMADNSNIVYMGYADDTDSSICILCNTSQLEIDANGVLMPLSSAIVTCLLRMFEEKSVEVALYQCWLQINIWLDNAKPIAVVGFGRSKLGNPYVKLSALYDHFIHMNYEPVRRAIVLSRTDPSSSDVKLMELVQKNFRPPR